MEEGQYIFGKCFICLNNSPHFNSNVSLHFLCKYLKLDLKGEKELSEYSDLSGPLCQNCEKNLEKFNTLYQSLEKIKMEMDYHFELIRKPICDNPVNGDNDCWRSVGKLRNHILPKCLERRRKYHPQVKINRMSMLKINIKGCAIKEEESFQPSILPDAISHIKLEEVDLGIPSDPEYQSIDFDDINPLADIDEDNGAYITPDDPILLNIKMEREINSETSKNESEALTKPNLKGSRRKQTFNLLPNPKIEREFGCNICGKGFKKKDKLKRHVERVHEGYREICKVPGCNKEFAGNCYLTIHMRQAHPDVPEPQKRSYKRLDYQGRFTQIKVNGETKLQCNLCKKLQNRATFARHFKQVHGPSTSYKCEGCEKSFKRQDSLKLHHRKYCNLSKESADANS